MEIINVTDEIIEINVTEEVVTIQAPTGAYPLPNAVNSVFGRVGNIVATEGDYTLTQLGDVTLTSPANGQVLKYNGTSWVNDSDAGVTGTGTTNTLPKFTGASTIGNSNVSDSGTLITLGSNTTISSGALGIGTTSLTAQSLVVAKSMTGGTSANGILNQGQVQSDVTTSALYNSTFVGTQAASFTLGSLVHYISQQGTFGAGSSVTTQSGYVAASSLIGATNNYGFRGQIPSGTNRWNLYMDGTANNYMAGGLGIATTNLTGFSLNVAKGITGLTSSYGISQIGSVQSDVTINAFGFINTAITAASAFTLTNYNHFFIQQGTFGSGSSVINQNGFRVDSSVIGATNNYAFRGQIPVGANRWNIYMDGMAANYLAGDTAIGTTTLGTATMLTVGGTETAVSAISRGQLINTTLVASANNDVLVGLDIAPTYTNGAFTGVSNLGFRVGGTSAFKYGASNYLYIGSPNNGYQVISANRNPDTGIHADTTRASAEIIIATNTSALGGSSIIFSTSTSVNSQAGNKLTLFGTGNLLLQNGGTFTDAGFRLDVNGTTRFIGTASSDTAPLGAELAAVTGTGTNWTLAGTNLNVGGYTHTTGSVDPLTTALAAVNGTYYQIAYTITGRTTGSITINYGGTSTSGITATGATGPLASSTAVLTITPTTDFNGTVVLSIKTIGTSAASSTFSNSTLGINIEFRASNINTNTFIGTNAGRRNSTGLSNTFFGSQSGINNTTGTSNTFIGQGAGQNNVTGLFNTFIGTNSGLNNIIGGDNTFVGTNAGVNNTGSLNTFLGTNTGLSNTTGQFNTFIGRSAAQSNTTGSNNVILGYNAGRFITGGVTANTISNNSIYIGADTRAAGDGQNNQIVIGTGTTGLGSNTTVIGTTATTITGLYGNIRLVSGMGTAPASSTATGTTGDIVVTAGFIYVCTATNTWVRTALTTW